MGVKIKVLRISGEVKRPPSTGGGVFKVWGKFHGATIFCDSSKSTPERLKLRNGDSGGRLIMMRETWNLAGSHRYQKYSPEDTPELHAKETKIQTCSFPSIFATPRSSIINFVKDIYSYKVGPLPVISRLISPINGRKFSWASLGWVFTLLLLELFHPITQ